MQVVVTGAAGFVGQNLCVVLGERGHTALPVTRQTSRAELVALLAKADAVVHLAGVNRPQDPAEFHTGNADFSAELVGLLQASGRAIPLIFSSSIQAERDNPYGASKRAAESVLAAYGEATGAPVGLFRLPNVFGKWARPNYNSAVATFCHNLARGLPIQIHDPAAPLQLVYVDDVVEAFLTWLADPPAGVQFAQVPVVYQTAVGAVADQLRAFAQERDSLVVERVGTGLCRALWATWLSHLPPEAFAYSVPKYGDARGVFVEMLKTPDCGQFSFFTAHPGITRGGHYHHSKTEKFLVLRGTALFKFRHIVSGARHELQTSGDQPMVVETIPGWTHDITNIGSDELIVMLWANEIFDRQRPDTVANPVG